MSRSDRAPPERPRSPKRSALRRFALVAIIATAVVGAALYHFTPLPGLAIYFIAWSIVAFALCAYDKVVAGRQTTRVPENVLFGSALLGGTAGLLLAMNLLRHKTSKSSFQLTTAGIMVAQAGLAYGLYFGL